MYVQISGMSDIVDGDSLISWFDDILVPGIKKFQSSVTAVTLEMTWWHMPELHPFLRYYNHACMTSIHDRELLCRSIRIIIIIFIILKKHI